MNVKRRLGQSDIMLSPLGVGTWQFGNKGGTWNTVTDKTVYEILKYSLTNGMNWIDTAEIYGNGISETLIGQALKQLETERALTDIPDDENAWRKRPVKSRVCGLKACMVRQEYDKINSLKGLK